MFRPVLLVLLLASVTGCDAPLCDAGDAAGGCVSNRDDAGVRGDASVRDAGGPRRDAGRPPSDGGRDSGIELRDGGAPGGLIVYLNFAGTALTLGGDDAPARRTLLGEGLIPGAFVELGVDRTHRDRESVIRAIATDVRAALAEYDARVVTARPAAGPFTMVVIGSRMEDLSATRTCGGAAVGFGTLDCANRNPSDVGFVSTSCRVEFTAEDWRGMVTTVALHELGHNLGLVHDDGGGIMTPSSRATTWSSGAVIPGHDSTETCGRAVQDGPAHLLGVLGPATSRPSPPERPDVTPPVVRVNLAADSRARPDWQPCIGVDDASGIQLVVVQQWLELGGMRPVLQEQHVRAGPPFVFPAFARPVSGVPNTIRVQAVDEWDNATELVLSVNFESGASAEPCP